VFVAADAGVGRPAFYVFAGEMVDHVALEFFFEIENPVTDPEALGDIARIFDAGESAAGARITARTRIARPGADRSARHFMAFFLQKGGRDTRVDTA
jgi:hypothetical protein